MCMDSDDTPIPIHFVPLNWLKKAAIYNQRGSLVPTEWLVKNADVIVLLFSSKGVDKDGIIQKFYRIYESSKYLSLPIEVLYIPFDETAAEYRKSYKEQANWFTLKFDDPLIITLKYVYEITSLPHITVIQPDCTIISTHGILDLEQYSKNAIISWLPAAADSKRGQRDWSKDAHMYGQIWRYGLDEFETKDEKRFTNLLGSDQNRPSTSPTNEQKERFSLSPKISASPPPNEQNIISETSSSE